MVQFESYKSKKMVPFCFQKSVMKRGIAILVFLSIVSYTTTMVVLGHPILNHCLTIADFFSQIVS